MDKYQQRQADELHRDINLINEELKEMLTRAEKQRKQADDGKSVSIQNAENDGNQMGLIQNLDNK